MSRPLLRLLALGLPLLGLGALWGQTHLRHAEGTEWEVPITGYDPADLLRGHFVRYSYQWPGLPSSAAANTLCINGAPPRIARTYVPSGPTAPCPNRMTAAGAGSESRSLAGDIFYVSQNRAARLQNQLATPGTNATLRFRLHRDGRITPLDIAVLPHPDNSGKDRAPQPAAATSG